MTSSRAPEVFTDWLDVTFSPNDCPTSQLRRLLLSLGFRVDFSDDRKTVYSVPAYSSAPSDGKLFLETGSSWCRASASGDVCAYLRAVGAWMDYLSELSSSPHKVTRLDAAMDLAMDGADLVAAMRARYPSGEVSLGRKAIRTSTFLNVRADGRETGTWYAGHRSRARVTCRVYDKAHQMLEKYGYLLPPTGRVEITGRDGSGVTLRDAAEPTAFFWHVSSPALLKAPEGIPMWQPNSDLGWTSQPREFNAVAFLQRRLEALAPELDALCEAADSIGPEGRAYLLRMIERRLNSVPTTTASDCA